MGQHTQGAGRSIAPASRRARRRRERAAARVDRLFSVGRWFADNLGSFLLGAVLTSIAAMGPELFS